MSVALVQKLVDKYSADRQHYISATYNEAQLRADFLDPFFEILGWDIKNSQSKPTNEREVLLEEALKEDALANTKKPDYTFRLYSERKFYLEAKKPSVKIENDAEPAKQTRRYGFTAKLKISVLSNFEYLAIYDCSQRIDETDSVNKARVKLYHYTEYVSAYEHIKKELGKESVYTGEFDKKWEDIEEQLKLFSVDRLFLEQINEWRIVLGTEIFTHRPTINESELNDIVQRYINSIIFLRVSEDRNLEQYKTLLSIASNDNFQKLVDTFEEADRKYNSGLFNHGLTEEIISNNRSAFWTIIKQLYYPESTYSFSVFASEILGNIYEIYLGQQLVVKEGVLSLEKKPDHINRDVITTPIFIIRDILRQTVLEYCKEKTDVEIFNSKFADIACGSGAFLLETYQLLNDILIDYYLANSPQKLIQTAVNSYKLPFDVKKKILTECLYGVDKDYSAVEACKFGLLLKLLEDEHNQGLPVPALPEISNVIHFGNSLIDSSNTSSTDRGAINPFDFETKFDVVIGNPPYMATEDMSELTPLEFPIYKEKYTTAYKQFDKYFLFIERGYMLLADGGYLGYIVPSKFTKVGAAKTLRDLLKDNKGIYKLVSFGANQIFDDKTTYTCLLILQKHARDSFEYVEIKNILEWKTRALSTEDYDVINLSELESDGWVLVTGQLKEVYEQINAQSTLLSELVGEENIYNGIQTSANDIYIHTPHHEDKDYLYFTKDGNDWAIEKILTRPYFKTSTGIDNLYTYRPFKPNSFVVYPYLKTSKGEIKFVEIDQLKKEFPMAYKYLSHYQKKLQVSTRDIKPAPVTENEWYRYGRHQSLDKCDVPAKIIVGVLSQGNKYAIDYSRTLISSGGTAGYCMITLPSKSEYSIYYIQALLNSKYLEWYSALIGEVFRGGYIARGTKVLKKLPIRVIDFSNLQDKTLHDQIASIQEKLISLQVEIDKNVTNDRELIPLKREFDDLKQDMTNTLKKLFGLGADDDKVPLISEMYASS